LGRTDTPVRQRRVSAVRCGRLLPDPAFEVWPGYPVSTLLLFADNLSRSGEITAVRDPVDRLFVSEHVPRYTPRSLWAGTSSHSALPIHLIVENDPWALALLIIPQNIVLDQIDLIRHSTHLLLLSPVDLAGPIQSTTQVHDPYIIQHRTLFVKAPEATPVGMGVSPFPRSPVACPMLEWRRRTPPWTLRVRGASTSSPIPVCAFPRWCYNLLKPSRKLRASWK